MDEPTIDRNWLYWKLIRGAQVRSLVTMASIFPCLVLMALAANAPGVPQQVGAVAAILIFFGCPLLVSWIFTTLVCKKRVRCPNCDGSLWECGTGNFKPRRLRIRDDATACPHCGIPIR
jgi:hypothetical protein